MSFENYTVRLAKQADIDGIMSMVERDYILDEPISRSFLLNRGSHLSQEELLCMRRSLQTLISPHPCLVVVHLEEIVGVLALIVSESLKNLNESKEKSGALHELHSGLADIVESFRLIERYPQARKVAKLRMMTVHQEHRGRGLSTLLLREATRWARENGIDLLWSLFNSPASKRAAEKAGFEVVREYDLLDYRNNEGRALFAPIEEHVSYVMTCLVHKRGEKSLISQLENDKSDFVQSL